MNHFWHFLIWTCVAWYSTITFLVMLRGWRDIREMLKNLKDDTGE